jgi:Ni/Co efflux regulator RcnB
MKTRLLVITAACVLLSSIAQAQYDRNWDVNQYRRFNDIENRQQQERERELERIRQQLQDQQFRAEQERIQRQWRIEQDLRNRNDRLSPRW